MCPVCRGGISHESPDKAVCCYPLSPGGGVHHCLARLEVAAPQTCKLRVVREDEGGGREKPAPQARLGQSHGRRGAHLARGECDPGKGRREGRAGGLSLRAARSGCAACHPSQNPPVFTGGGSATGPGSGPACCGRGAAPTPPGSTSGCSRS